MRAATILYDRDCGFCRWSLRRILAWDRRGELRPVALQDPEADRLLAGLDPGTKMGSWHLVTPDGRAYSAGAAAAPLLRLLPGGRPVAIVAAAFPGATERVYRLVSRNRDRLGRWVGANACALDPEDRRGRVRRASPPRPSRGT
jgi:predicted DCC family thiol-disulfide oxidoreductase YuxK